MARQVYKHNKVFDNVVGLEATIRDFWDSIDRMLDSIDPIEVICL